MTCCAGSSRIWTSFPAPGASPSANASRSGCSTLLAELIDAAYRRDKTPALRRANRRLQVVRHLWRLCCGDARAPSSRSCRRGAMSTGRVCWSRWLRTQAPGLRGCLCPRRHGLERRAPAGAELGRTRPAGRHRGLAKANSLGHRLHQGSGPTDGRRVIRGGSWNNKPRRVRSANRNRNDTDNRNNNLGFRLAQSTRASPEPARPWMRRARRAGVHEPASRPRKEGSDE